MKRTKPGHKTSSLGICKTRAVTVLTLLLLLAEDCRATFIRPPLPQVAKRNVEQAATSEDPSAAIANAPFLHVTERELQQAVDVMTQWFPKEAELIEKHRRYAVQTILEKQALGQRSSLMGTPVKLPTNHTQGRLGPRYFTDSDCKDAWIEAAVNLLMFITSFMGVVTPKPSLLGENLAKGLRGFKDEWFATFKNALMTLVQSSTLKQKTSALFDLVDLLVFNGGQVIVQAMKETYSPADWVVTGVSVINALAIFGTSGGTAIMLKIASKYLSMAALFKGIIDLEKVCVRQRKYTKLKIGFKGRTRQIVTASKEDFWFNYTLEYLTGVLQVTLPSGEVVGICYDGTLRENCPNCYDQSFLHFGYVPDSKVTNAVICKGLGSTSTMPSFGSRYTNLPAKAVTAGMVFNSDGKERLLRGVSQHFNKYLLWSKIKCDGFEANLGQCVYSYKLMKSCRPTRIKEGWRMYEKNYEVHANCWKGYTAKKTCYIPGDC
jgi:hypothetical protein